MPWVAPIIGYVDNVGRLRCSECARDDQRDIAVSGGEHFGADDVCESCRSCFVHLTSKDYVQVSQSGSAPDYVWPPKRDYYVSLRRGERTALLAGPFETHAEALATVDVAVKKANEIDPRTWFDPFGTMSLPRDKTNPNGRLNGEIGVTPRAVT